MTWLLILLAVLCCGFHSLEGHRNHTKAAHKLLKNASHPIAHTVHHPTRKHLHGAGPTESPVVTACKCVSFDKCDLTHARNLGEVKGHCARKNEICCANVNNSTSVRRFNYDGRTGLFAKEGASCAAYVECKDGTAAAQTCAHGQGFSKVWQKCMWNGVVESCTQERAQRRAFYGHRSGLTANNTGFSVHANDSTAAF